MERGNGKQNILWECWQLSIAYDTGLYWDAPSPPPPQESVRTKDVRTVTSYPDFLALMGYQISLSRVLRCRASRAEVPLQRNNKVRHHLWKWSIEHVTKLLASSRTLREDVKETCLGRSFEFCTLAPDLRIHLLWPRMLSTSSRWDDVRTQCTSLPVQTWVFMPL